MKQSTNSNYSCKGACKRVQSCLLAHPSTTVDFTRYTRFMGNDGRDRSFLQISSPPRPRKARLTQKSNRLQIYVNRLQHSLKGWISVSISFGATLKARLYSTSLWCIGGRRTTRQVGRKYGTRARIKCDLANLLG